MAIVYKEGNISLYNLYKEEKVLEFDSYKIINESKGIMMIQSEDDYGLYSSESGIILNSSYDQILTLDDGEGNIFFKALQLMQDAQLLVSIIIDIEGNIIINQGLDIRLKDKLLCTGIN